MTTLGLDLNASRVRAVRGPLGEYPCAITLEPERAELPLAVWATNGSYEVGGAALHQARRLPHQVTCHFLPRLGHTPAHGRSWISRRHDLEPHEGLQLVLEKLEPCWATEQGIVVAAPAYLTAAQLDRLMLTLDEARVPWIGSVASPIAAALAAYAEQSWLGPAVLLDVDEHALTLSVVRTDEGQAQLMDVRTYPSLGLETWKSRLLNGVANICIRGNRWDPRADADAEQSLYDQLDAMMDASRAGLIGKLALKTATRFLQFVIQPEETSACCASLCRQAVAQVQSLFAGPWPEGAPRVVLAGAAVARLPGMITALQAGLAEWGPTEVSESVQDEGPDEDFGRDLLQDNDEDVPLLMVLADDATARGAHALAPFFQRGDLPRGHLEVSAPLPLPQPPDAGPPRLYFKGQVFFLHGLSFTLGRHAGCDLVFDADVYPGVAPRHCEIVFDHRLYLLRDRSRDGTFVNDVHSTQPVTLRPGDWIRLGPGGPVLRFLGQPDHLRLMTTA